MPAPGATHAGCFAAPPAPKVRMHSFAIDERLNTIYVSGSADIIAKAKQILDELDKGRRCRSAIPS